MDAEAEPSARDPPDRGERLVEQFGHRQHRRAGVDRVTRPGVRRRPGRRRGRSRSRTRHLAPGAGRCRAAARPGKPGADHHDVVGGRRSPSAALAGHSGGRGASRRRPCRASRSCALGGARSCVERARAREPVSAVDALLDRRRPRRARSSTPRISFDLGRRSGRSPIACASSSRAAGSAGVRALRARARAARSACPRAGRRPDGLPVTAGSPNTPSRSSRSWNAMPMSVPNRR